MQKNTLEIALSLAMIALSFVAYFTIGFAEDTASSFLLRQERSMGGIDYQTVPKICAIVLAILSALNILIVVVKKKKVSVEDSVVVDKKEKQLVTIRIIGTLILLLIYALLLAKIPFALLTFAFIFSLFRLYGQSNYVKNAMIAAAISAGFWLLFIQVAKLSL